MSTKSPRSCIVQLPGTATATARRRRPVIAVSGTESGSSNSSSAQVPSSGRFTNPPSGTCIGTRLICSSVGSAQARIGPITGSTASSSCDGTQALSHFLGHDGIEVLLAGDLGGGDEALHAGVAPARHDLDVEPGVVVALGHGGSLVEPHHVRHR